MGAFFVSWDLWQEMTFVLGCSIVIVFFMGVIKLWWTNRITNKLEILDAEKRARKSDISYCGMDAWRFDGIPFGVRAIQRGVEVDGIWISRLDLGDVSQIASSATLIEEVRDRQNIKGKLPEPLGERKTQDVSSSASANGRPKEFVHHSEFHSSVRPGTQVPTTARRKRTAKPQADSRELQETIDRSPRSGPSSCIPRSNRFLAVPERRHRQIATDIKPTHMTSINHVGPDTEYRVYGAARIHANRDVRKHNDGFEILPAGALGPRRELQDSQGQSHDLKMEQEYKENAHPHRGKLRKKTPSERLRPTDDAT